MRTKLAAFTMVELIAVMVLSGLIFSMAMLVIGIVQEQAKHQEQQHEEVLAIEQLKGLLKKDAYAATDVWVQDQQLLFDYETYSIHYFFNPKNICRKIVQSEPHIDTFRLPTLKITTTWQLQEVQEGRVDAVELKTQFFEQNFTIFIKKAYDYKTLMQIENK
ncbi:type II secretion system protein [Aureispira sp. CCB-E]|uniref:type II secretion system protein n=1 Tax=Aureispira sp. CCB-E TaxID=3051121 RepID=UPI002868FB8E|nr:type II secretion system protein [Aureispira sp. CCB-E]WMX12604.1 type II secretion system protein [Aureispira sp. CCB-E]